jgi:hypothetical protein
VVDLHRRGVDVRFERRGVVRQRRQGMSHGTGLLNGELIGLQSSTVSGPE